MSAIPMSRRAAIVSLAAVAASTRAIARSLSARNLANGGVRVDVGPLLENSGEPTAGWVAHLLPAALSEALASAGAAPAPVSVRIEYVLLGPNSGGLGPAGSSQDQMIGTVTSGGVTRPLRASSFYYPAAVDPALFEQSNYDRVAQLCQAFAYWVARGY